MMRVEFIFNGTSQIKLIPQDGRDKQLLQMALDGRPTLHLKPSSDDSAIIEFSAPEKSTGGAVAGKAAE